VEAVGGLDTHDRVSVIDLLILGHPERFWGCPVCSLTNCHNLMIIIFDAPTRSI
jgi:hypothetical protein